MSKPIEKVLAFWKTYIHVTRIELYNRITVARSMAISLVVNEVCTFNFNPKVLILIRRDLHSSLDPRISLEVDASDRI